MTPRNIPFQVERLFGIDDRKSQILKTKLLLARLNLYNHEGILVIFK